MVVLLAKRKPGRFDNMDWTEKFTVSNATKSRYGVLGGIIT